MIMSYLAKVEMSYFKEVIIPNVIGGYYGRREHYYDKSKGIEATEYNPQGN